MLNKVPLLYNCRCLITAAMAWVGAEAAAPQANLRQALHIVLLLYKVT